MLQISRSPIIKQHVLRRTIHFRHVDLIRPGFWPATYFTPVDLACNCCQSILIDYTALKCLDNFRAIMGVPITVNSGYRCIEHNRSVGSQDSSLHPQGRAFDIALAGREPSDIIHAAHRAQFRGFGTYQSFIHIDDGPERSW